MNINEIFSKMAKWASYAAGTWQAFASAVSIILIWLIAGIWSGYGDPTYQLIINTITTIITFLMVFLIQHRQNHDSAAMQLKLDEIIRSQIDARNAIISIEEKTEEELKTAKFEMAEVAEKTL